MHLESTPSLPEEASKPDFDPETDALVPLSLGRYGIAKAWTIVSLEDFPRVSVHRWSLNTNGYAVRRIPSPKTNRLPLLYLHLWLMGVSDHRSGRGQPQVDHKNRDKLDNRRWNLRLAGNGQNHQNMPKSEGHTSKYRNVHWATREQRWVVTLTVDGNHMCFGYYEDEDDAGAIAKMAREDYMPFAVD